MSQWFYRIQVGREQGPFLSSRLLELIRSGEIDGETEVRKDDSPWVPACQINGLWQAAGKPSVAFKCPFCNSEIDRPPTKCKSCNKQVTKAVGQLVPKARPTSNTESWTKTLPAQEKPKAPPLQ